MGRRRPAVAANMSRWNGDVIEMFCLKRLLLAGCTRAFLLFVDDGLHLKPSGRELKVMKLFFLALYATLFLTGGALAQSRPSACQNLDPGVAALIGEYKELRERRSRLAEGEFDKDVRGHSGRLQEVLSALGTELGRPPYTREIITVCMGAPDAVKDRKQMGRFLDIYRQELKKAGRKVYEKDGLEYLVYFWRGMHDFLFFIIEDGVVKDHGWWFAYE